MSEKVGLMLMNLSKDEIKEIMEKVRDIEQRDPARLVMCWILGVDSTPNSMSAEQAERFVIDIFPPVKGKECPKCGESMKTCCELAAGRPHSCGPAEWVCQKCGHREYVQAPSVFYGVNRS